MIGKLKISGSFLEAKGFGDPQKVRRIEFAPNMVIDVFKSEWDPVNQILIVREWQGVRFAICETLEDFIQEIERGDRE